MRFLKTVLRLILPRAINPWEWQDLWRSRHDRVPWAVALATIALLLAILAVRTRQLGLW